MKKTLLTSCLLLIACTGSKAKFETQKIEVVENYSDSISASGRLRSAKQAFISVKNGGTLDALNVASGQLVKANQILAVIDKETRAANLERALSNYKLANTEFQRVKRLYRNGSTTQSEFDKSQASLSVSEAELKVSKEELNDAIVRAPIDGKVVYFAFREGDTVPDGSRLAVIEDPETVEMRVKIPFDDVKRVLSQKTVTLAKYNLSTRTSEGASQVVRVEISQLQTASDYDSGYGELRVLFTSKPNFQTGELVQITLFDQTIDKVWSVPTEAVVTRDSKNYIVLQLESGDFKSQQISLLSSRGGRAYFDNSPESLDLVFPKQGTSWQAFMKNEKISKLF